MDVHVRFASGFSSNPDAVLTPDSKAASFKQDAGQSSFRPTLLPLIFLLCCRRHRESLGNTSKRVVKF